MTLPKAETPLPSSFEGKKVQLFVCSSHFACTPTRAAPTPELKLTNPHLLGVACVGKDQIGPNNYLKLPKRCAVPRYGVAWCDKSPEARFAEGSGNSPQNEKPIRGISTFDRWWSSLLDRGTTTVRWFIIKSNMQSLVHFGSCFLQAYSQPSWEKKKSETKNE